MRSAYIEQNSGAGGYLGPYQRITAAVTLTAVEDSGKGFLLDSAGGAYTITLPTATTAAEGTNYKFWVEENTPTGAITIAAVWFICSRWCSYYIIIRKDYTFWVGGG